MNKDTVLKYRTIAGPGLGDFRDRGSRFPAFAYPVHSAAEIKTLLQALRKEHPKANHHCYAWRLGSDKNQYRAVDDGEPAGSAGRPILGVIDSMGLTNVLCVVVRYFGGTLLGVPGLINAYKTAAHQALSGPAVVERWMEERYEISFDYPEMGPVLRLLEQSEATIIRQELQLFCTVIAGIPKAFSDVVSRLSELRGVKLKRLEE